MPWLEFNLLVVRQMHYYTQAYVLPYTPAGILWTLKLDSPVGDGNYVAAVSRVYR